MTEKDGEGCGPSPVVFFCKYLSEDADLMRLSVDEELFGGHLHTVTTAATGFLKERSDRQVRAILGVCDTWLTLLIDEAIPVSIGGAVKPLTRQMIGNVEPMSMLPYAATYADGISLSVTDVNDEQYEVDDISAAEVCAAYALAQVSAATRHKHIDWEVLNGAYHAMHASQAWGMAVALGAGGRDLFLEAAAEKAIAEKMRDANRKRWASDPTQHAKAEALALWKEWQDGKHPRIKTVEQFAIEVCRRYTVLKSIKNVASWSAKWSKDRRNGRDPVC